MLSFHQNIYHLIWEIYVYTVQSHSSPLGKCANSYVTTCFPWNYCYCIYFLRTEATRCKARGRRGSQEAGLLLFLLLLCSTEGIAPDILMGMMLSKPEGERAISGEGRICCMLSPSFTRLPKQHSVHQVDVKAHSRSSNSQFPSSSRGR